MPTLPLLLLWFATIAAAGAPSDADESKAATLQKHYDQAFHYYSNGDYGRAIQEWEEILHLDPQQKTARQMIKDVQRDIEKKNAKRLAAVYTHIKEGRYQSALSGLETLLENGEHVTLSPSLQPQLEEIIPIIAQIPGKTKPWKMTALALNAALEPRQDLKLAYNGLRYAAELNPAEKRVARLLDWFLARHPEFVNSDNVTPGMTLLEYKRSLALDHIYGRRYHQAIDTLNEVLALEPNDLVALKRLGTAYYSLELPEKARETWQIALKLDPKDAQLKKFLKKLPAKRTRSSHH